MRGFCLIPRRRLLLSIVFSATPILSGLLVLGFICNALVRPVAPKYFMNEAELAAERAHGEKSAPAASELEWAADPSSKPVAVFAWLVVGVPLAWGVWITLQKTVVLFQ